jgi:hypothetical protein
MNPYPIRRRPDPAPPTDPAVVSCEWAAPWAAYDHGGRIIVARRTFGEVVDALIGRDPFMVPISLSRDTGIVHGPERVCEIAGCDAPAMHVHGRRCGVHTFAPRLSREPLPLASRCGCPDDCNCRSPHRTNYCGCGCRAHYASRRHER